MAERSGVHHPGLWAVLLGLTLAVLVVTGIKGWRWLHPPVALRLMTDPGCDAHVAPCTFSGPDGLRVELDLSPRPLQVATPLEMRVRVQGLEARAVWLDFAGVDMDMGYNRVALTALEPGDYRGSGMLGVCVRDQMLWEASALIDTEAGLVAAPVRFTTRRR